ncbi:MAG: hypothetical protein QRY72_04565 [Candidatus Rhabdochlamydia sp.]
MSSKSFFVSLPREYCTNQTLTIPSFDTIEGGVKTVEDVLKKKILCDHDVNDLTQAYEILDQLEKKHALFQENIPTMSYFKSLRELKICLLEPKHQLSK